MYPSPTVDKPVKDVRAGAVAKNSRASVTVIRSTSLMFLPRNL